MDYLQYTYENIFVKESWNISFKPYYKWITFNTLETSLDDYLLTETKVLNLIINGLPSIL